MTHAMTHDATVAPYAFIDMFNNVYVTLGEGGKLLQKRAFPSWAAAALYCTDMGYWRPDPTRYAYANALDMP